VSGGEEERPAEWAPPGWGSGGLWRLAQGTLVVVGVTLLVLLVWQLANVLTLAFAAVVVATVLRSFAGLIGRVLPISGGWALVLACAMLLGVGAVFAVLLGAQLSGQFANLFQELPAQLDQLGNAVGVANLADLINREAAAFAQRGNVMQSVLGYTSGALGIVTSVLLVVVAGIYLAANPDLYVRGTLTLIPEPARQRFHVAFDAAGRALRLWFLGQLVSMLVVAVLIGGGLYVLGVPSALALGVVAGIGEFVPVVGPILSAVPALLVAFSQEAGTALWVLALFVVVQQIESNVLLPLIQRETVDLPPALTAFALVAFGVLLGPVGVLLAAPLTVVAFVGVKQLYVRDMLKEATAVPGEDEVSPPKP
jgi:predicted PurR-regulated permease PerM